MRNAMKLRVAAVLACLCALCALGILALRGGFPAPPHEGEATAAMAPVASDAATSEAVPPREYPRDVVPETESKGTRSEFVLDLPRDPERAMPEAHARIRERIDALRAEDPLDSLRLLSANVEDYWTARAFYGLQDMALSEGFPPAPDFGTHLLLCLTDSRRLSKVLAALGAMDVDVAGALLASELEAAAALYEALQADWELPHEVRPERRVDGAVERAELGKVRDGMLSMALIAGSLNLVEAHDRLLAAAGMALAQVEVAAAALRESGDWMSVAHFELHTLYHRQSLTYALAATAPGVADPLAWLAARGITPVEMPLPPYDGPYSRSQASVYARSAPPVEEHSTRVWVTPDVTHEQFQAVLEELLALGASSSQ